MASIIQVSLETTIFEGIFCLKKQIQISKKLSGLPVATRGNLEWVKEQVGQVYMEQKQDVEDTLIEEKYGEKKNKIRMRQRR